MGEKIQGYTQERGPGSRYRFRNHQMWVVDEALALSEILRERLC